MPSRLCILAVAACLLGMASAFSPSVGLARAPLQLRSTPRRAAPTSGCLSAVSLASSPATDAAINQAASQLVPAQILLADIIDDIGPDNLLWGGFWVTVISIAVLLIILYQDGVR
eukprot:CAMPEP_0206237726 /NCGR_PEP_ID=MMETSP0047_2-20121206/14420_1 /ASSEMBLY_ACC=CAM_ASM_000192 /TAXON_ID=195065 /ORGANISM="Chroomonas mesostigmatica_cf, Strain CCMP1168" /LENGTH=114 /DNA_ID=CAMNT_0053662183 /DNA_START=8 /DNA_END=352 /DNA_ORIENTATION=+